MVDEKQDTQDRDLGTSPSRINDPRIRLEVSSSNFPRFDRNLNTGGPLGLEAAGRPAVQRVWHGGARPSHLVLPIIPPA